MLFRFIIALPMMVCLFWAAFFLVRLVRRTDEPRVGWTIVLFYTASTVLYVNHWLFFSDTANHTPYTYLLANLSVYPLYYAYLRALTRTRNTWDNYVLFIPAVLVAFFFPLNARFGWIADEAVLLFVRACFAVQVVWVWISGYRLLRTTQRRMDDTYADDRSYLLEPTHTLLILIGITAVVSTLLNILGRDTFDGSLLVCIPAVLMAVLLYSLGYVAAHTTLPQETVAHEEAQEDRATTEETDELMHKIATTMRKQQLYADPHLTIQDLSTAVSSNRTYVSNCINRRTGLSFSQYIARYRVEYAQTVLLDAHFADDREAVTAAMTQSGFASEQTFYRVFKEQTGLTPLQFRQKNLKKS